ncbi:NFX1-type zinc finger-containing protein 1-like [Procambarus clarkii]|uniref:NFX1-type zinc finger-containing protein 1-like n=1 Tax=Procambarus clarkii TaxID=6728 RepID=UPI003743A8D5
MSRVSNRAKNRLCADTYASILVVQCPPCQEECQWRCTHSRCRKICGIPCTVCKMNCDWKCKHLKCTKLCGEKCSRNPCDQACPLKLNCGHPCVGFCGDPCPPLCRICDAEELTEFILLGYEEDADARFVLLEDCGHTIEVQGLEGWLGQETAEIGMKTCPKCRKPIYNNRRYQDVVLKTYEAVKDVKYRYKSQLKGVERKEIELILKDPKVAIHFNSHTTELRKKLDMGLVATPYWGRNIYVNEGELRLIQFQSQVLMKATRILMSSSKGNTTDIVQARNYMCRFRAARQLSNHEIRLRPRVAAIVKLVMVKNTIIAPQMVGEVSCELERLMILPAYWTFNEKCINHSNDKVKEIKVKLEKLMDPTIKFNAELDTKIRALLKESEEYVGGLGINESEKIMILKAMGLKQGHWYKCPNGHVYCITECGGAMVESSCPDCGVLRTPSRIRI